MVLALLFWQANRVYSQDLDRLLLEFPYEAEYWNPRFTSKVEGHIANVSKTSGPVLIAIERTDKPTVLAFMPPFYYLNDIRVLLLPKEPITVVGCLKRTSNHGILYVSEFEYQGKRHQVRNDNGKPLWVTY